MNQNMILVLFVPFIHSILISANNAFGEKGLRNFSEYFIEHETSKKSAENYKNNINGNYDFHSKFGKFGCKPCSKQEYRYCLGPSLIDDHCCCDKKHFEPLSSIPHTCYVGVENCRTIAANCEEYSRLRTCCCETILQEKNSSNPLFLRHFIIFLLILNMVK